MNHRKTVVCLFGLLFLSALAASAQTSSPAVDWKGLGDAWNAYYTSPSEAGAEKLLNLLPGNVKITASESVGSVKTVNGPAQPPSCRGLSRTGSSYFFWMKFSSMLVNSIGKINLVEGAIPIAFSVSKYCKVIVF